MGEALKENEREIPMKFEIKWEIKDLSIEVEEEEDTPEADWSSRNTKNKAKFVTLSGKSVYKGIWDRQDGLDHLKHPDIPLNQFHWSSDVKTKKFV